jgi:hypothetical protein
MNILDEVMTPRDGLGTIVGLPDADFIEVRLRDAGGTLRTYRRDDVEVLAKNGTILEAEIPAPNLVETDALDTPLGKSGRPLSGAALAKHQAKQQG